MKYLKWIIGVIISIFILIAFIIIRDYKIGGIKKNMKTNLISFNQYKIGEMEGSNELLKIEKFENNDTLTISFIIDETLKPYFEGGFLIENDTLNLYYQDIDITPVTLEDYYKLEYKIDKKNLNYKGIKIRRFEPINKLILFKD